MPAIKFAYAISYLHRITHVPHSVFLFFSSFNGTRSTNRRTIGEFLSLGLHARWNEFRGGLTRALWTPGPVSRGRKWLPNNSESASCLPSSLQPVSICTSANKFPPRNRFVEASSEPRGFRTIAVRYGRVNSLTNKLVTFRRRVEVSIRRRLRSARAMTICQPRSFYFRRFRTIVIVTLGRWPDEIYDDTWGIFGLAE